MYGRHEKSNPRGHSVLREGSSATLSFETGTKICSSRRWVSHVAARVDYDLMPTEMAGRTNCILAERPSESYSSMFGHNSKRLNRRASGSCVQPTEAAR